MAPVKGFNDFATLHPELIVEWDFEKNEKNPDQFTEFSSIMVNWKCSKGHCWSARIYNRVRGRGCPFCAGHKPVKGETDLATLMPKLAAEWDYEANPAAPTQYTKGSNAKVGWVCAAGHKWNARIVDRSHGTGCPFCTKEARTSQKKVFHTTKS